MRRNKNCQPSRPTVRARTAELEARISRLEARLAALQKNVGWAGKIIMAALSHLEK